MRSALALALALSCASGLALGCKKRVTEEQCGSLLDRYASLVVATKLKDAGAEAIRTEQAREREAAKNDDGFKNCTTELTPDDYSCAMKAATPDAIEKCLE